ncbi:MAG: hypothetical protein OIF51_00995 [Cellvibrionaceae bacterium]|nr:hypothetical protein [Cellvibrionaceae bacterium]
MLSVDVVFIKNSLFNYIRFKGLIECAERLTVFSGGLLNNVFLG